MTLRKASLPKQVQHIQKITKSIDGYPYIFINDNEAKHGIILTEGEWLPRLNAFMDDPQSGIGDEPYDRLFAMAILTKRYSNHLDKNTVRKLTQCLTDPKPAPTTKEQRLKKLKRDLKEL